MQLQTVEPNAASSFNATRDSFTSLEWLVIAVGAQENSVSLQWSPLGRSLLQLMEGGGHPAASPCLETLRRTAGIARRCGWGLPSTEIGAFLRTGWSEDQLECLIESVFPVEPCMDEWPPCNPVHGVWSREGRSNVRTTTETYS